MDFESLFDTVEIKQCDFRISENKHELSQEYLSSQTQSDSYTNTACDGMGSPVIKSKKSKKIAKIYKAMDYDFDYTDWSGKKPHQQSTPTKKKQFSLNDKSEINFRNGISPLRFDEDSEDEVNVVKDTINDGTIKRINNSVTNMCSFDDDSNDKEINQIENTSEERSQSPFLFERSPIFEGPKTFPKKLVLWPPASTLIKSDSMTSVEAEESKLRTEDFVTETNQKNESFPVASNTFFTNFSSSKPSTLKTIYSEYTTLKTDELSQFNSTKQLKSSVNSDQKIVQNRNVTNDIDLPSVKNWLEQIQNKCFGNITKGNSSREIVLILKLLRDCEKEVYDMVFQWFTSIPAFVAEQIAYVMDATDLIKLRMFKTRISEKITEFESLNANKFEQNNLRDDCEIDDHFSRLNNISEQVTKLSNAMKIVKQHISPKKNDQTFSEHKSKKDKKDNLVSHLFSSDSDEDMLPKSNMKNKTFNIPNFTKTNESIAFRGISASAKNITCYDNLPSTQDVERVFANWKEAKKNPINTFDKTHKKQKMSTVSSKNSKSISKVKNSSITYDFNDSLDNFDLIMNGVNFSDNSISRKNSTTSYVDDDTDKSPCIIERTAFSNVKVLHKNNSLPEKLGAESFKKSVTELSRKNSNVSNKSIDNSSNLITHLSDTFNHNNKSLDNSNVEQSITHITDTFARSFEKKEDSLNNLLNRVSDSFLNSSSNKSVSIVDSTPIANPKFKLKVPIYSKNFNITNAIVAATGVSNIHKNVTSNSEANESKNCKENSLNKLITESFENYDRSDTITASKKHLTIDDSLLSTSTRSSNKTVSESMIFDDNLLNTEIIREFESADEDLLPHNNELHDFKTYSTLKNPFYYDTKIKNFQYNECKDNFFVDNADSSSEKYNEKFTISHVTNKSLNTIEVNKSQVGSVYGKFDGKFPNDGITGEFSRNNYPHSSELNKLNLQHLINHYSKILQIPAAHLLSETSVTDANAIYKDLCKTEPIIKLLYVTPEKVASSSQLRHTFTNLFQRNLIARFVIDEAHCVSQWGHDFRPDYKRLCALRENYSTVPIMALTATATPRVRNDILHQLSVKSPKWFISSFNRPNLKYEVVPKKSSKGALDEIIELIKKKFNRLPGILYCLSRKECDSIAETLNLRNIKAMSYHAGLSDKQRNNAQSLWISNKVQVVCATIAFGMGIDKPDVRFVIHHSMPKSIEGYYQESGRAGRDGKLSWCILYYSFADLHRLMKLIELSDGTQESKSIHKSNLWRIVRFCENKTDCRRSLQLNYFGEHFKRDICISKEESTCDNCSQFGTYKNHDVTEDCKAIVNFVNEVCGDPNLSSWKSNFTANHIVDVFYGSNLAKVRQHGHDKNSLYGRGKSWERLDIERLIHQLIFEGYLFEKMTATRDNIVVAYVKVGPKAFELLTGDIKIMVPMLETSAVKANIKETRLENKKNNAAVDNLQEECYEKLMDLRTHLASEFSLQAGAVMTGQAIQTMSEILPTTEEEMLNIDGVTKANFDKFGRLLLEITKEYAAKKLAVACLQDANNDDADTMLWQDVDDTESPYFENSSSNSSQFRAKKRKAVGGKKFYRRKTKRAKKRSPKKKTSKKKRTIATAKSPKKSLMPNRALTSKKLGFVLPKTYAHMREKL
ncbi:hypothetical protein PGB90_006487 [Kerria lacca]